MYDAKRKVATMVTTNGTAISSVHIHGTSNPLTYDFATLFAGMEGQH
jgi:hypothetical protein